MRRLVVAAMMVAILVASGCSAGSPGPAKLASTSCPVTSTKIKEKVAIAVAEFGRMHCSHVLSAIGAEYGESNVFAHGQAVSPDGCLITGTISKAVRAKGMKYCFAHQKYKGVTIFMAMQPVDGTATTDDGTKPVFFIAQDLVTGTYWVYSAEGGAYGAADSVVNLPTKPSGGDFAMKTYVGLADGTWEAWTRGLTLNATALAEYANNFRRFLHPHDSAA